MMTLLKIFMGSLTTIFIGTTVIAGPLQCVVDGHGPYEQTEKQCLEQAKRQARTNCVLHGEAAKVKFTLAKAIGEDVWKLGTCYAEPMKKKEDCLVKKCEYEKKKKTKS